MADLPKWARTDGEKQGGDLEVKLVGNPSEEDSKPVSPATDPPAASGAENRLASRTLCFFRVLAVVSFLLALLVIGTNCYIIYDKFDDLKARGVLLRVYGILFCVFVLFAELEWSRFTKYFGFLKYWPARGVFYVFVGLITWDQTGSTSDTDYGTYEDIISFMMMGVGVVYFLLGLACMHTVKEAEEAAQLDESTHA